MITQYVVATDSPRTRWGWDSFYKTKEDALRHYDSVVKAGKLNVRVYEEKFKAPGSVIVRQAIKQSFVKGVAK